MILNFASIFSLKIFKVCAKIKGVVFYVKKKGEQG